MTSRDAAFGQHSWYRVFLLTGGHFSSDFYANFLPALLPLVIAKLGLSLTMSGLLIMILSFSSNVLQPFFGYFLDRRNLYQLLLLTIPASAVFICFIGYVTTKQTLFLLVAMSGVAVSMFHPLGSSLITKVSSPAKLGSAISIFVAGGNLGFALAPVIIVYFTEIYGLDYLPVLILPSLLLTLAYFRSGIYRVQTVPTTNKTAVPLATVLLQPSLVKLNIAMGLRAWTHVSITTFLPLLLVSYGHSATYGGVMLSVFLMGCSIGGLICGYLNDRIGAKRTIILSLLTVIVPNYIFLATADLSWLSYVMLFLCGAGLQGAAPSSLVWAQKLLPDYAGIASGMMLGLSFGLGGVGTAFTGLLADYITLPAALMLTILPVVGAVIITMLIPSDTKIAKQNL